MTLRAFLVCLATVVTVVACGSSQLSIPAASAASVAVQTADVPKTLLKCSQSGSIDSYLSSIKTTNPTAYSTLTQEWATALKNGATNAQVAFYTDSKAHCDDLAKTGGTSIGTATYPLTVNYVLQFKDEATASKGYTSGTIMGIDITSLKSSAITGKATGLGANSLVIAASLFGQSIYIAVWQNKAFMVILGVLNVDQASSQKIATKENSHIH
jgi:hypothetical protein